MNQTPIRTASAVMDAIGAEMTTIPAIRLITPKKIVQPVPIRVGVPENARDQRRQALDHPGQADDEADQGDAEMQVPDQHQPGHDEHDPRDPAPDAAVLLAAERLHDVVDPGDDHEDAEQHGDHGQRRLRAGRPR